MIKIVNPLSYPLAVLAGGITLVLGVRAQLPNIVMLPASAVVATAGAIWLKSRQSADTFDIDNPELATQLQAVCKMSQLVA